MSYFEQNYGVVYLSILNRPLLVEPANLLSCLWETCPPYFLRCGASGQCLSLLSYKEPTVPILDGKYLEIPGKVPLLVPTFYPTFVGGSADNPHALMWYHPHKYIVPTLSTKMLQKHNYLAPYFILITHQVQWGITP